MTEENKKHDREDKMKIMKTLCISMILLALAIPTMADKAPKGLKPADAYIKAVKIAMLASPPRLEEALGFLDTVLTFHGSYPEAYFYKGNIFAEYANNTYDPVQRLDYIAKMSASYDSMKISCADPEVKSKLKKNCKDYSGIVDSIGEFYWRENFNQGVVTVQRYDETRKEMMNASDNERPGYETRLQSIADSARTFFTIATLVHPDNYRSYEGLGLVYDREGNYDSSLTYYTKASEIAPDSISLIQNVAYAYIQKDDWTNSITWFQKYLSKIPEDAVDARVGILSNIAICFTNSGHPDSAYLYNTKVISLDPDHISSYLDNGRYFLQLSSEYSDSIKIAQQNGNEAAAKKLMASRDAALDSSAVYLKAVFEKEPDNARAVEQYAVVSVIRGHNDNAQKAYAALTELEPDDKNHWIGLGDCLIRQEKFAEAISPYEKAVELDPSDLTIWELLVELYSTNGQTGKANEAQKKVNALKS